MAWYTLLKPDLWLGAPAFSLTSELLRTYNLKGIILDVDNTLVPTYSKNLPPDLSPWIAELRSQVQVWLVSNNFNGSRISTIAQSLDLPYLASAGKPSRRKLRKALAAMDLPPCQVAMVGDRLFTDVLAGNRLGLFTILVDPVLEPDGQSRRHYVRSLELWVFRRLGARLLVPPQP